MYGYITIRLIHTDTITIFFLSFTKQEVNFTPLILARFQVFSVFNIQTFTKTSEILPSLLHDYNFQFLLFHKNVELL